MSNIYIQEPPTEGKVLLKTSVGDIDVELWSKETPKACRNFIQLCLEGYYNKTIFHRLVPGFIVQGGDPTGTGDGGDSIYGKTFRDEFHSRLRFNRRGLVGMANAGSNDNASQFFFTLDTASELDRKHTLFGKVSGNTVFNMMKLGDGEVGPGDRPVFPHKILSTQVLHNPFDDIVPRELPQREDKTEKKTVQSTARATKAFNLLSFGDEAEEDEEEISAAVDERKRQGVGKSSHELLDDPTLSRETVEAPDRQETEKISADIVRSKLKVAKVTASTDTPVTPDEQRNSWRDKLREEAAALTRELRGKKRSSAIEPEQQPKKKVPESVAGYEEAKSKYDHLRRGKTDPANRKSREKDILAMMNSFQDRLKKTNFDSKVSGDEAEELRGDSWLSHRLECEDKDARVLDANVYDSERYDISDPRNPMTKRRNKQAKKEVKQKEKEKRKRVL